MKAVAVSAEYFDDCQSSSPRQGPGANSFSLLMREIQSVLFYTSIFNIINFQVFVNTEFMKDTGNGVHNGFRNHRVLDGYRKHSVHNGYRKHRIHVGYRKGWTDHKKSGEPMAGGIPIPGAAGLPQITLWNLLWTPRRDNRFSPCGVPCICGIPPLRRRCIFFRHKGGICLARQPVTGWA